MLISRTLPAGRRRIFFSPVAVKSRCFSLLEKSSAAAAASALPQFTTGKSNGFLPRNDPLVKLPKEFDALESLLQRMPLNLPDGKPGLLAQGKFGDAVEKELPLIDVSKITDSALLTALFRDYTFAASAYLLEPCDLNIRKTGNYGLGRELLPKQLAGKDRGHLN